MDDTALAEMDAMMDGAATVGEMHRWMNDEGIPVGQMHRDMAGIDLGQMHARTSSPTG